MKNKILDYLNKEQEEYLYPYFLFSIIASSLTSIYFFLGEDSVFVFLPYITFTSTPFVVAYILKRFSKKG